MRLASVLPMSALLLAAAPVAAQSVTAAEAGRQSFQLGRALYDQRRWAEALDAFRTSNQVLPSPNTLLYVGRCHRELGRNAEAYRALLQAARDADARRVSEPRYAPTADAAQREAAAITERVGFVIVEVPDRPPALTVTLNGEALDPSTFGTALAVDPGALTLEASAAGRVPFRGTSAVAAGQQARMTVQLPSYQPGAATAAQTVSFTPTAMTGGVSPVVSTSSTNHTQRILGITALGAGVALGVAGVFTGLRAREIQNDLDRICPAGCGNTRGDVRSMVDEGNSQVLATNVLWGVGGALAVTGVILWVTSPSSGSVELFTPSLAVRPYVDPVGGSAGVTGRF